MRRRAYPHPCGPHAPGAGAVMADLTYSEAAPLERLRSAVRGTVTGPADAGYDAARSVFFASFDRRPGAVVRAADAADVAAVLAVVRETGVPLAVRSGGHSPAGHGVCDGGVVLDLAALSGL